MICPQCQQDKPATTEYWYQRRASKTGFQYICKSCDVKSHKALYEERTDEIKARNAEYEKNHQEERKQNYEERVARDPDKFRAIWRGAWNKTGKQWRKQHELR